MTAPPADATRAHWDQLAATYDLAKSRNDAYYAALKALMDESIPRSHRGSVLEVGCGTGQLLASLEPRRGVGIDLSPAMIDQARARAAGRSSLLFEVMDAAAAASLGPFDAVLCADVLEHVEDWPAVTAALARAAKPGGLVVITTPNPRWAAMLWILERLRLKMPEGPHRFVAGGAIARRLRDLGCSVTRAGTHLILPVRLAGLGPRLSHIAATLPLLRSLGVIQLVVAVTPPATR
jgi:SAM-dependent methyltransferase